MLVDDEDGWGYELELERDEEIRAGELELEAEEPDADAEQRAATAAQETVEGAAREEPVVLTLESFSMLTMYKHLLVAFQSGGIPAAAAAMRLIDIRFAKLKAAMAAAEASDEDEQEGSDEEEQRIGH